MRPEFGFSSGEDGGRFFGELDAPSFCEHAKDTKRAPSAEPALGDLFEVLDPVNDVSPRRLLRKIQEMDGTGGVRNIHGDVADLSQAVRALVDSQ